MTLICIGTLVQNFKHSQDCVFIKFLRTLMPCYNALCKITTLKKNFKVREILFKVRICFKSALPQCPKISMKPLGDKMNFAVSI